MNSPNDRFPERRGLITASRAYDVLSRGRKNELFGQMALTYAEELALARIGVDKPSYVSQAMINGTERQPLALDWYSEKTGSSLIDEKFIIHPDFPFCGASPDAFIVGGGIVEVKCPEPTAHFRHVRGIIEPKYIAQMQFQLWVTGEEFCDFVSWSPEFPENIEGYIKRFYPGPEVQDALADRCQELEKIIQSILVEIL